RALPPLFALHPPPPIPPLFPYTTLFRSDLHDPHHPVGDLGGEPLVDVTDPDPGADDDDAAVATRPGEERLAEPVEDAVGVADTLDRKSTRLNSSHVKISYAVFCLKKKIK